MLKAEKVKFVNDGIIASSIDLKQTLNLIQKTDQSL